MSWTPPPGPEALTKVQRGHRPGCPLDEPGWCGDKPCTCGKVEPPPCTCCGLYFGQADGLCVPCKSWDHYPIACATARYEARIREQARLEAATEIARLQNELEAAVEHVSAVVAERSQLRNDRAKLIAALRRAIRPRKTTSRVAAMQFKSMPQWAVDAEELIAEIEGRPGFATGSV